MTIKDDSSLTGYFRMQKGKALFNLSHNIIWRILSIIILSCGTTFKDVIIALRGAHTIARSHAYSYSFSTLSKATDAADVCYKGVCAKSPLLHSTMVLQALM